MNFLEQFPDHIQKNLLMDSKYYSMDLMANIERCKVDEDYLGDVLLVNESLIWHSVHKYIGKPEAIVRNNCIEKDDILQLGRMGYIKSIKAFDTSRAIKFSSFSVITIVREIRCFLRDSASIIRPTRTANELLNRIRRVESEMGYQPNVYELAILLGETEDKITKALQIGQSVKYLDEPINTIQSQEITLLDTVEDGEGIEEEVLDKVYVDSVINSVRTKLNLKELDVLQHRINGFNQTQTAKQENISQMRVSRIMKKVARLLHDDLQTS